MTITCIIGGIKFVTFAKFAIAAKCAYYMHVKSKHPEQMIIF